MFKDIQVTLYDIFGYFLPGVIVVLALCIFFWAADWARKPLVIPTDFSAPALVTAALIAYVAGHLSQALGNFLEKLPRAKSVLEKQLLIHDDLVPALNKALAQRFGDGSIALPPRDKYQLCDQTLIHHGSLGEREIFTYREGFYRGVCIALVALAVAFLLRLIRSPATLWLRGSPPPGIPVPFGALALIVLLCAVGAWLSFERYLRFAEIRIRTCLLRFVALATAPAIPKKEG